MTRWWGLDSGTPRTATRTAEDADATTRRSADRWGVAGHSVLEGVATMSAAAPPAGLGSRLPAELR